MFFSAVARDWTSAASLSDAWSPLIGSVGLCSTASTAIDEALPQSTVDALPHLPGQLEAVARVRAEAMALAWRAGGCALSILCSTEKQMPDAARPDRHARYLRFRSVLEDPFVELDLSLGGLAESDVVALQAPLGKALSALQALEAGGIANADEKRMVGHFWLRAPGLAPSPDAEEAIARTIASIEAFAQGVHSGRLTPPEGGAFTKVVLCGIGGSALGPMLLADVFGTVEAPMSLCVLDNTDPEGIDLAIERLGALQDAVVIVISKSGGTPETRNGMLEVERACKLQGLTFAPRAVAVTLPGSQLHQRAEKEGWAATFPIWDWVGGRTSIT